jgi:spermidine/putrescine transport system permease protein
VAFSLDFSRTSGHNTRERTQGRLMALPALLWLIIFFLLPLFIVLGVSFLTRGRAGTITLPFTIENYERVFRVYSPIFVDSIWIAFVTTVICLIVGYPLAFFISTRKNKAMQQIALFLVILPFWTNFLVRTYAWRVILGTDGIINASLLNLGMISEPLNLLNNDFAVMIGLVYGFLPFMVLPIYSSIERFDFRLVEAAHDLGANDLRAFFRIVLPLTLPGVAAGCILVFIPTIGAYITPDLLGGTEGWMIGNVIDELFKGTGHAPRGAAASMIMMVIVGLGLLFYMWMNRRKV